MVIFRAMLFPTYPCINLTPLILRNQHTSIPHLTLTQMLKRPLNTLLVQRVRLNHRPDPMDRRKLHHLIMNSSRCYHGALHANPTHQQRHIRELEIAFGDGQGENGRPGRQYGSI